jgi:pimeloyl-ACP methyl ester carboxylesterase
VVFALVHGAWHGGWVWNELAAELELRGHRVVAPDLPCEDVDAGALDYAQVVVDALDGERDAIVVGHSLGGVTIALVPARMHVYLSAFVPQPGQAPRDRGPGALAPGFADAALRDELGRSYWPDPAVAARDLQYPPGAEALAGRLRRQARKPSAERCPLAALPEIPRASIVCANDRAVPPEWQRRVAYEELQVEPIELNSGHSPMLGCPSALAEILDRLAANKGAESSS